MTSLDDLIARVEGVGSGSRELDAHVEIAARAIEAERSGLAREQWAKWTVSRDFWVEDPHTAYEPYPHTRSIDAAVALASRLLPGHAVVINGFDVSRKPKVVRKVIATLNDFDEAHTVVRGEAKTIPLALVSAILKATTHGQ